MDCNQFEQQLDDYLAKRAEPEVKAQMEAHLHSCASCRKSFALSQAMEAAWDGVPQLETPEKVKSGFYGLLDKEMKKSNKVVSMAPKEDKNWYKTAFQLAASLLLLIGGYYFGSQQAQHKAALAYSKLENQVEELRQKEMLAMIQNQSPSKRIQAVNYTENWEENNNQAIVDALIERLHFDANSNVRLAALEALLKFSAQEKVRKAFVTALNNDKDPSLQIELIHILASLKEKRALKSMKQLLDAPETPNYIREEANAGISKLI